MTRHQRLAVAFAVCCIAWSAASGRAGEPYPFEKHELPADAKASVSPRQALDALSLTERSTKWAPEVNDELSRGPAAVVYPKVAPATVVVRTPQGHGTGFVIDPQGWIVTNHHVAENGRIAIETGGRYVLVYFGKLDEDGVMTLEEKPFAASVMKSSPEKDLALLKLVDVPGLPQDRPVVEFAEEPPRPGVDCVAIGHPTHGMLWTVRSGEVSQIGTWPQDHIQKVMTSLALTGAARDEFGRTLASAPKRKVVLSTCGINPGDSGGPLLNTDGELIATTFAIPKGDPKSGISVDKFSYHVHLDEVRAYVADRPQTPQLVVPSEWPPGVMSKLVDENDDGKPDSLVFGSKPGQPPTGVMVDLDNDTPPEFDPGKLSDEAHRKLWDSEITFERVPAVRAYYDRDDDGQVDLVLTDHDRDRISDLTLERGEDGTWARVEREKQAILDPSLFADEELRQRCAEIFDIEAE